MQPTENYQEPGRSYPISYGRPVAINGLLFIVVVVWGLLLGSGYGPGGWDSIRILFILLGSAMALNVVLAIISSSGRIAYLAAIILYSAVAAMLVAAL